VIREALAAVARNESLGGLLSRTPGARDVVKRVVGGDSADGALAVAAELADRGMFASLERAAPTVESDDDADEVLAENCLLIDRIVQAGLAQSCEVTVFPDSLAPVHDIGSARAFARLLEVAREAEAAGVSLMVGMGGVDEVDRTLDRIDDLHGRGLPVGVTLQACLRRTEADCHRLADRRVRLVKGAHRGDPHVAHDQPLEVDKAYVRCAKTLLGGNGNPSFATHDPRLIEILESLAERFRRDPHTFEYAFYMGRLEGAQVRLSQAGDRVRIYVPYGPDWFERLVGGLAEQPTSIVAAVRSLLPGTSS